MIGIPRDLYEGAFYRDTFEGDWKQVKDLKRGSKSTRVKSGSGWETIENDTGLQIAAQKGR